MINSIPYHPVQKAAAKALAKTKARISGME